MPSPGSGFKTFLLHSHRNLKLWTRRVSRVDMRITVVCSKPPRRSRSPAFSVRPTLGVHHPSRQLPTARPTRTTSVTPERPGIRRRWPQHSPYIPPGPLASPRTISMQCECTVYSRGPFGSEIKQKNPMCGKVCVCVPGRRQHHRQWGVPPGHPCVGASAPAMVRLDFFVRTAPAWNCELT